MRNLSIILKGIVALLVFVSIPHAYASDENYTLHLKDDLNLKDIFDAGIRPKNVPGMTNDSCKFTANSLKLILFNGSYILTKKGYCTLYISADLQIVQLDFYEDYDTSIDECLDRMLNYRALLNSKTTEQEIRDHIQRFRVAEDHWSDPFGISSANDKSVREIAVQANHSFNRNAPFRMIIAYSLIFGDKMTDDPVFRPDNMPLTPPAGYEQWSMEPEPIIKDNTSPRIYFTPREQAEKIAENIKNRERSTPSPSVTPEDNTEQNTDSVIYDVYKNKYYIILFVFIVAVIGIVWRKSKRKSTM